MNEELLAKLLDTLSCIDSSLSGIAESLETISTDFDRCMVLKRKGGEDYALSITGDVYTD